MILFKKVWKWFKRILLILFITSLVYVVLCKWIFPPTTLTQLYDYSKFEVKKQYVTWDNISYNIKLAAIASEDQTFPDHGGFDWDAIEKSLKPRKGRKKKLPLGAAASTITQQTAKNVFLWKGNGIMRYLRKIPEVYFTKMIEWTWGKKRILEVYLNVIEMGPGIYGVEAASQHYFAKHANQLSKEEAAKIIACLPNPKKFSIKPISKRVAWRFPQILREMRNLEEDDGVQSVIK